MFPSMRSFLTLGLISLAITGFGCGESGDLELSETPEDVITPRAADEAPVETDTEAEEPATHEEMDAEPAAPTTEPPGPDAAAEPAAAEASAITMELITYDALMERLAQTDAKYTMIDCWASWCGPCKENFPHLLEMDEKYRDQGLDVVSVSFDGGTGDETQDAQTIAAAEAFLTEINASNITNYLLDEFLEDMFEKFDINGGIPAVFVYDSEGQLVKRYTGENPNDQFTYEQVEEEMAQMLQEDDADES